MKMRISTSIKMVFSLLLVISILGSCKKKTTTANSNGTTTTTTNSLSYKLNGATIPVNSIYAAVTKVGTDSILQINALTSNPNQSLLITLDSKIAVGASPLTFFGINGIQYTNNTTAVSMGSVDGGGGNIVVTKHDLIAKIIEATFYSPIQDDISSPVNTGNITDGILKIKY